MTPPPTIILPVFDAADDVRRCLSAVSRHSPTVRLIVVDDASRDLQLRCELDDLATAGKLELIRHDQNQGYTQSINDGLAETSAGDVVLLNSDAIVTAGWLDKLQRAALSRPNVATVTPLSNDASICTVPKELLPASLEQAEELDAFAATVETHSLGLFPEILVGVGFCMYVRRAALDAVGPLDVARFGRGYGEEVDFCLRARAAGFVHLLDDATFVYHRGGASFGPERHARMAAQEEILAALHPDFPEERRRYAVHNPAATVFTHLATRLRDARPDRRPHLLVLMHRPLDGPGGVERHMRAVVEVLREERHVSVAWVDAGHLRWSTHAGPTPSHGSLPLAHAPAAVLDEEAYQAALRHLLALLQPQAVLVEHLEGHSLAALDVVVQSGAPVLVTLNDYFLACPNYNLLFKGQSHCGIPDSLQTCADCLRVTQPIDVDQLLARRAGVDAALARAAWVLSPSQAVLELFARAFPTAHWRSRVLEPGTQQTRTPRPARSPNDRLRVAYVGHASVLKGWGVFVELAEASPDLADFFHLGSSDAVLTSPAVRSLGSYTPASLAAVLHQNGIDIVVLPALSAETFSHVLTEVLLAGVPILASDLGALGARLRAAGAGWTVPAGDVAALRARLAAVSADRRELDAAAARAQSFQAQSVRSYTAALVELAELGELKEPTMPIPGPARWQALCEALATDNAHLGEALDQARREAEILRRRLGDTPQIELEIGDVQAGNAYRLALSIQRAYRKVPVRIRQPLKNLLQRLL